MRLLVRKLPVLGEVALVTGICFGWLLVRSVNAAFCQPEAPIQFTDRRLIWLVVVEVLAGGIALLVLHARGHQWSEVRLGFTWGASLLGVFLLIADFAAYAIAIRLLEAALGAETVRGPGMAGSVSKPVLVLASLINPVFEELFLVGYLTQVLSNRGALFVLATSTLLRLGIHLYQGPIAFASIIPMGLLFAGTYWYRRNLWPLILAHMLGDIIGLGQFVGASSG